jgi:hypothetical protein
MGPAKFQLRKPGGEKRAAFRAEIRIAPRPSGATAPKTLPRAPPYRPDPKGGSHRRSPHHRTMPNRRTPNLQQDRRRPALVLDRRRKSAEKPG